MPICLGDRTFTVSRSLKNFLGRSSFKTTMDMYGRISIDEIRVDAVRKLEVT